MAWHSSMHKLNLNFCQRVALDSWRADDNSWKIYIWEPPRPYSYSWRAKIARQLGLNAGLDLKQKLGKKSEEQNRTYLLTIFCTGECVCLAKGDMVVPNTSIFVDTAMKWTQYKTEDKNSEGVRTDRPAGKNVSTNFALWREMAQLRPVCSAAAQ